MKCLSEKVKVLTLLLNKGKKKNLYTEVAKIHGKKEFSVDEVVRKKKKMLLLKLHISNYKCYNHNLFHNR